MPPPGSTLRRLSMAVPALAALGALALLTVPATAAPARPDVAPLASTITFTKHAFKTEPQSKIRFCERTYNYGNARTPRRLHNHMELVGPGGIRAIVARRDTPRLPGRSRPGGRGAPVIYHSHGGCGQGENVPLNLPLGAYNVRICADLRIPDSHRANNCKTFTKAFVVAKRSWDAVITGTRMTVFDDSESWQSAGAMFTFARRDQYGRFVYDMTAGSVSYKYAQTIPTGCDRTGAGTDSSPSGELVVDYVRQNYYALGRKGAGFSFDIHSMCANDEGQGPSNLVFLDSGIGAGTRPFPFGTEQIAGVRPDDGGRMDWIFR